MKKVGTYLIFRVLCTFFLILFLVYSHAQNHDYSWHMGSHTENFFGIILDFRGDTLRIDSSVRDIKFHEVSGSVCDTAGNLQFYTNGCKIFNYNHEPIVDSIWEGELYSIFCNQWSGMRWNQGVLILPTINNQYQIFYENAQQDSITGYVYVDEVYRTVIDMDGNNGNGSVTTFNDIVLQDTIFRGRFSVVRHANGQDWWMLLHQTLSDSFHIFHLNADGVKDHKMQALGISNYYESYTVGQSKFTPDGKKYLMYDLISGLQIFDFNRGTGVLSNPVHIPFWHSGTGGSLVGGIAISPNSRYAYVSSRIHLDQFDLEAENIEESRIYIDEYDGVQDTLFDATFYLMQLAPDGKIYMSATNGIYSLHVINSPDSAGLACNFVQRGQPLPAQNSFTMPYFPNFRLGADSTLLEIETPLLPDNFNITLSPNPARYSLQFEIPQEVHIDNILIIDLQGNILQHGEALSHSLDVSELPPGMYLFHIRLADGREGVRKFVKM